MKKRITGIIATLTCMTTLMSGCSFIENLIPGKNPATPVTWNVEGAAEYLYMEQVDKNETTRKDYTVPTTIQYLGGTYTIEWTVDVTQGVSVVVADGVTTIDVDEMLAEDLTYVLTATLKDGNGQTATEEFTRTVLKIEGTVCAAISAAPVEGKMYKYHVYQQQLGKDLYFNGKEDGFYFGTTEDYEEAVDVFAEYLENSTTEFHLAFNVTTVTEGVEETSKQYIGVQLSSDKAHNNIVMTNTPVSVFKWNDDASLKTVTTTLAVDKDGKENSEFYLGNYSNYDTISASTIDNAPSSNVGHLVEMTTRDNVSETEKVSQTAREIKVDNVYGSKTVELPVLGTTFPDVAITYAVSGTGASYANGALTLTAAADPTEITLTATITCGEASDTKEVKFTLFSDAYKAVSLAEANAAIDGFLVEVTGVVVSIESAWSTKYNNMDVTISDGTNTLKVYRLASEVALCDNVTIKGQMASYKGARQIGQGATAMINSSNNHTSETKFDATNHWTVCANCETKLSEDVAHTFTDGTCSCGAVEGAQVEKELTLSFADVANRKSQTEQQQVWEQNGVKVTNDKASSSSNVADYSNPARFYKSSSLLIECAQMTKIVFTCDDYKAEYPTALQASIGTVEGVTVTVEGVVVTVEFTAPVNSFAIATLSAQIRIDTITVYAN